ncbi:MAG: sigma-70 family RNA polymerase sigma factor [Candidatus Omnitrophica bacterium]|nr:sigma-70 family RNA polymerase sigma factor [Candidatus Omnitrophota bacterium]
MVDRASDEILAVRAREGDTKAFEELFHRYKKPILNLIYRLIGNKETAEEAAQEAFMKAYKNLDIFDPKRKFSSWIYTIARNLAKNALRDRKYFRDVSLEKIVFAGDTSIRLKDVISDPGARPDSIVEDEEISAQAQQVLNAIPLKYREVIALCRVQGLTYKEAAEVLGCSAATVAIRFNRAKILFMKKLGIKNPGK